jgi:hypothetical protein
LTSEIIPDEKLEGALLFLAETDIKCAEQKAELERTEILRKRCRARMFLSSQGSVDQRKALAEVAPETQLADDAYIAALTAFEGTKAKRERADIIVRVYQTLSANRRQG